MRWLFLCQIALSCVLPANAEQRVTLSGLPVWDTAPLLELVQDQPVKGVTFAFLPWQSPDQLSALLLNGRVQIASAPSTLLHLLRQRGLPATLLGSSKVEGNLKIVARAQAASLAVPFRGGTPDLILRRLRMAEPAPKPSIRHTATPAEAMQLMLTGRVDGAFLAEPLATMAIAKGAGLASRGDICTRWIAATGGEGCPVTGVYLAFELEGRLAQRVEAALSNAHRHLARRPGRAADLLEAAFPDLAALPLAKALARLSPTYSGPCAHEALAHTMAQLDPLTPIDLLEPIRAAGTCPE